MENRRKTSTHDFKGLGFSKIGYFKEVRSKIAELERLNLELARRHNQLETIFNSMSEGLTILDRDLKIVFANRVQKSMFPAISLIGQKCYKLFYRKENICRNCPALSTMETGETSRGEVMIREGELAGHSYEWTTSPIKNPVGNVDEILLIMRDITQRKDYEFKIMQANRMAAIGFLAAGVAHEINNPLTSIAGFSEGLLKRLSKLQELRNNKILASFREYLEIIHNEAYRCKDITRRLLEFSRSSTDDYEIIEIDKIISDTVSLIWQHAKDSNIKIIVKNNLAKDFNKVLGNESQLKHVFLSLFNTGFRAMEDGGALTVEAKNDGNRIQICISDSGGGYSQKFSHRIFDLSWTSKQMDSGSALDLSICYRIIKNHKGEFQINRMEGKGSTLTLHFPAILP
jgi:two-component system, NtrC family, sensor kinase